MLKLARRDVPRLVWQLIYRRYRVSQRETAKIIADALLYGRGTARFSEGELVHVPYEEIHRA